MKKHTREMRRRLMQMRELIGQDNYEKVARHFAGRSIHFPEPRDLPEDRESSPPAISEDQAYFHVWDQN